MFLFIIFAVAISLTQGTDNSNCTCHPKIQDVYQDLFTILVVFDKNVTILGHGHEGWWMISEYCGIYKIVELYPLNFNTIYFYHDYICGNSTLIVKKEGSKMIQDKQGNNMLLHGDFELFTIETS